MDSRKAADDKRRKALPWRRWYYTRRWKLRREVQLKIEPLCRMCRSLGKSRRATTADHVEPHRGDPVKFWQGELQSLCDSCHSSPKQKEEADGFARDIGDDGWPIDPRHPFNKKPRDR